RRAARGQRGARRVAGRRPGLLDERQEVRVAPDVLRAALDAAPQLAHVAAQALVVVAHLQRSEAALAHIPRLEAIFGATLTTSQVDGSHESKNLRRAVAEVTGSLRPHLSGIGTVSAARADGCRGFIGPVPPPLWMCPAMSAAHHSSSPGYSKR